MVANPASAATTGVRVRRMRTSRDHRHPRQPPRKARGGYRGRRAVTPPAHRVLRVPRATLVAAVAPEQLGAVLASLKAAGVISGYEERPQEVVIWGDLLALESRLGCVNGEPQAMSSRVPV
jgi:hypothetical protein